MSRGVIGVVVFITAYVVSILLYVTSGMGYPHVISDGSPSPDGTRVTIDIEEMQSSNSALVVNLRVFPGPALLDPESHYLKDDLSVLITSAVAASKRTWSKGTLPDVVRSSLSLRGEVADWPFDQYHSGPVQVEVLSGAAQAPEKANVTLVRRLLGWKVNATPVNNADPHGAYRLDLVRSPSTVAFGVVILSVLIALAGLALFVATQTVRDRRKFQPPMTTWYAAMLFAVMPLRNALPDAPPFGSWIDVTIVLWVVVVLVISMMLYINCWWRHLRPDDEAPRVRRWTRGGSSG